MLKQPQTISLKKAAIAIVLTALLTATSLTFVLAQAPSSYQVITSGVYPGGAAYTIFVDNGVFYAKNAYGSIGYTGTNATTLIQQALDALPDRTSQAKIVFTGDFALTGTVTVPSYVELDWRNAQFTAPASGWAFVIGGQATETRFVTVNGGYMTGTTNGAGGIKLDSANYCSFYDVNLGGLDADGWTNGVALKLDGYTHGDCILNKFFNCRFLQSGVGVLLQGTCNGNIFTACSFDNNAVGFQTLHDSTHGAKFPNFNEIIGGDIEANSIAGIDDNTYRTTARDIYFEQNTVDFRGGNVDTSVQPTVISRSADLAYNHMSYSFGANLCDSGIFKTGERNILDGYVALNSSQTQYTVTFPTNYQFSTLTRYGYTVLIETPDWAYTSMSIVYGNKGATGFQVNFETATPDANRSLFWKVFINSI